MGKHKADGQRMTGIGRRRGGKRRFAKCAGAAIVTAVLALQPCASFASLAALDLSAFRLGGGYEDWEGEYIYDAEGNPVYVTHETKTYEDGTSYEAEYRYDSNHRLIYSHILAGDGSEITENRNYKGDSLVSSSLYAYDASDQSETNQHKEYGGYGTSYSSVQVRFKDGTYKSEEEWYQEDKRIKVKTTGRDGVTEEADYAYDGSGNLTSEKKVSSDGTRSETEYQYDGSGEVVCVKEYTYDSSTQTSKEKETRSLQEGPVVRYYTAVTETGSDGQAYKTETWSLRKYGGVVKRVTTGPDGSQVTESYTYDSEENEVLYEKSDADGMLERRETTIRQDREQVVFRDREGNVRTDSVVRDRDKHTYETTENHADGSSLYRLTVYYMKSSRRESIERERTADGQETYSEELYDESGKLISDVTRYPDGGEDRLAAEYNEAGERVKDTETRRNGISAVTVYQPDGTRGGWLSAEKTYSNGMRMTGVREPVDADTVRITLTFSAGDVAQAIQTEKDGEASTVHVKTIYRDGRTEEAFADFKEDYEKWGEVRRLIWTHYAEFEKIAWETQPAQEATAAQAVASDDPG